MTQHSESDFLNILRNKFGFNDFKNKDQKFAIESIVNGQYKNVIISMAANSGKSLCYLMPRFFCQFGVVLVISSHITRIKNELEFLANLGIPATTITSETSSEERVSIIKALKDIENNPYYFFYVTPEMIVKGSEPVKEFIDHLLGTQIFLVAIDEAHLLKDTDFRESYQELKHKRIKFPNIPWIALTTASPETIQVINTSLLMTNPLVISGSCARTDIFFDVKKYDSNINIKEMIADLIESDVKLEDDAQKSYSPGIIYCRNSEESDKIAEQLFSTGVPCKSYHLMKNDRHSILKEWKDGTFPILITHEGAFNLGIGRSFLKFVVFLSFPQSLRTFYQRSGRINVHGGCSRIISVTHGGYGNFEVLNYIGTCSCRHEYIAMEICKEIIKPCIDNCNNCVMQLVKCELNAEQLIGNE